MAVKKDFVKGNEMNRRVSVTAMMLVKSTSSVVVTLQVGSGTHHHAHPIRIHHPEVCKGE
jgi:hypothetical protein